MENRPWLNKMVNCQLSSRHDMGRREVNCRGITSYIDNLLDDRIYHGLYYDKEEFDHNLEVP